MFFLGLFTHTRTQTQHYHDGDAMLTKRGNPETGCRLAVGTVSKMHLRQQHRFAGEKQWENIAWLTAAIRLRGMTKQICGESNRNDGKRWHDSRSHEKVAGCRLGTVALAPSNTERQTVDSLKAAGTAPPCPPFSSMYLSRTFALLSRSNCSSIAVFRSYTRSFFPLLSFCLSCCPCVHFLSSLFTFVLVVHACFCSHFFFHSIFVYPWSK